MLRLYWRLLPWLDKTWLPGASTNLRVSPNGGRRKPRTSSRTTAHVVSPSGDFE